MPHKSNGSGLNLRSRAQALGAGLESIKDTVEQAVERKFTQLRSASSRAARTGRRKLSEMRAKTGNTVSRNPFRSLIAATGAGLLLGFLWGRR
ncbi:MAG: DUF883 family protein [Planctomycetes bacterium]|nr:DUF883 family protein [Planctomycetota bacterium]